MTYMNTNTFSKSLLKWFDTDGRKDLPWQENKTFYRVWISEIMLQQTQVSTAIPYYEKFMQQFPKLADLAAADPNEVLNYWAGLGYYARARNLHKAAQMIINEFNGQFPTAIDEVESLPGIGHSTACAILSIVDNQPLAICDGNVKRVLARFHAIDTPLGEKATENQLLSIARKLMPTERAADYTQAIMDLGATLCTRTKPACERCPVQMNCKGYASKQPTDFPVPKKRIKRTKITQDCVVLISNNHIALQQRPNKGIWGGLFVPLLTDDLTAHELYPTIKGQPKQTLVKRKHVFTHIDLFYTPHIYNVSNTLEIAGFSWHNFSQLDKIALPAPIKTLIDELLKGTQYEQLNLLPEVSA